MVASLNIKAVIPVAGLGTRLLPFTKEVPKEMLPLIVRCKNGSFAVKPILQVIFENLFDVGFRDFCFIVGRGKRVIEDYFTPDYSYIQLLISRGKRNEAESLEEFYRKISLSRIVWINQDEPRGFGDAVYRAKLVIGNEPFLVHAGDTIIYEHDGKLDYIRRLLNVFSSENADAVLLVREVEDPRMYGVVYIKEEISNNVYLVERVEEKPQEPKSNLAIMPIYVFHPIIFKAIERTPPGKRGEIELTDAIQKLIEWGLKVLAVKIDSDTTWIDVGTPDTYLKAFELLMRSC